MTRIWGEFSTSIKGGFEMSSKHDILTAIITVVVLAMFTVLIVTNHTNTIVDTIGATGIGSLFTYWFTRGGNAMGQTTVQPTQPADTTAQVAQAVLSAIAQTPAQPAPGGTTNAGVGTGSNSH